MVFNFIVLFATGWIGISTFVSAVPASQSYASDYYATQSIPSPEPSFSIATRRRINNCDEDWMKGIEAQAWADAGEIAKVGSQWVAEKKDEILIQGGKPRKWQAAMDYFMGTDSTNDGTKDQIALALNNEKKAHEGNWIFPELVIDIYCGKHPTEESACMLKTNPHNPTGPKVTAFATSWTDRGWFWNTYNIVLCPRFFVEKDSLWKRLSLMKYGNSSPTNASEYKLAWGHTIYHELMHLDPVIAQDEVWDVTYGACNVARLAKKNGCTGDSKWPGWNPGLGKANSMNNADSWAMFASAAYFQSVLKLDSPGTAPDCDLSSTDIEPADVEGILLPPGDMVSTLQTAKVPPDPDPSQIPAPDGPTPVLPIDANSPPSGLATPYADAVAYFDKMTISSPPTPSSSTSSEACIGNQVQGTCMAGSLPSAAPYSGTQGPSCEKDFGGAGSTGPRLNSDKASQAANNWCAARISEGLVLDGNSGNPKADVTKSVAEGGKDMVLNVMFDVTACPSDKSKTTLNFTALGQQNCGQDLYTAIETVCQEDRTWANFNKDFTLQGGVFGADCGLWSIYGQ